MPSGGFQRAKHLPDEYPPRAEEEIADMIREANEAESKEAQALRKVGNEILDWLVEKNSQYGSSAFDPVRIFSKADVEEQIKVRLDDKISRLVRGHDAMESDEDVIKDIIGYGLILLAVRELKKVERDQ